MNEPCRPEHLRFGAARRSNLAGRELRQTTGTAPATGVSHEQVTAVIKGEAVGSVDGHIARTTSGGRGQYNRGGQILIESRSAQITGGEFENGVAIFVRHPQVTAAVECDRFKMLKRVDADSKNRIDNVGSRA